MNPIHENGTIIKGNDPNSTWEASGIVAIADRLGLRWGGRFGEKDADGKIIPESERKTIDRVHFDLPKVGGYVHPDMKDRLLPYVSGQTFGFLTPSMIETEEIKDSAGNIIEDKKLTNFFKRKIKNVQGNQIDFTDFNYEELQGRIEEKDKRQEDLERHVDLNQNITFGPKY
jgi:hypothetical protein